MYIYICMHTYINLKRSAQSSGASIKISQKGEYFPGTQNRIVTISGSEQVRQELLSNKHSELFKTPIR